MLFSKHFQNSSRLSASSLSVFRKIFAFNKLLTRSFYLILFLTKLKYMHKIYNETYRNPETKAKLTEIIK